jgi:hypothetical protein
VSSNRNSFICGLVGIFSRANIMFLGELNKLKDVWAAFKTSIPSWSDYKT